MDLSTSQFNVGEQGSVLDGCASPLPGSPGGCGVVEPSGRPPSLSGRGLCGVCPTSALLYFCISPAMPLLPLRILSSQMPPTPLACRPSPPLPSTDLGLAAGQPWGTCPRAASLSHVCHLLCPELPLGPLR